MIQNIFKKYAKKMRNGSKLMHRVFFTVLFVLILGLFPCGCTRKQHDLWSFGENEGLQLVTQNGTEELTDAIQPETAEEAAGSVAGETAGSMDGEAAGGTAGNVTGEAAGSTAGSMAGEATESAAGSVAGEAAGNAYLYVHVSGAVCKPGVYELPAGSRVFEAVAAAGGFAEDAAEDYVNQAQVLTDAGKLVIPTRTQAAELRKKNPEGYGLLEQTVPAENRQTAALGQGTAGGQQDAGKETAKVNINTADLAELCTLPGVGEAKAKAILAYREKKGNYQSIRQIMQVEGIKEGLFEKIKEQICVD